MRSATMRKNIGLGTLLTFIAIGIALLASFYLISSASAQTVVFQDDFEAETLGAQTLTNWTVTPAGGIDVIGPGFADMYPGNGLYVDMAGCTNGTITSPSLTLPAGTYQLSFEMGFDFQGSTFNNALLVSLGSFSQSFPAPLQLTLTTVTILVPTATTANLVFQETGPNDCGGTSLDDVLLIFQGPLDDDEDSESDDDSSSEDDSESEDSGSDD